MCVLLPQQAFAHSAGSAPSTVSIAVAGTSGDEGNGPPRLWYKDKDWLTAISTAAQALVSLLALLGAGIAVIYARRSWLASEHTLAASLRPVIGVELFKIDSATGVITLRLKNVGNGVANGVYYWDDTSNDASFYWSWSRWPYDNKNQVDMPRQLCTFMEVKDIFDLDVTYPETTDQVAFIFCAFDAVGAAIQTKTWIIDRDDETSYVQSVVNTRTPTQVRWFYDLKALRNEGMLAFLSRVAGRMFSDGF
jgi:hypothetical protein